MRTCLPYPSIRALTLLKQLWPSWEQLLVWDWIQSFAACFLEIGPASVLVISSAASPPALKAGRQHRCCLHFTRSHFCCPGSLQLLQWLRKGLVRGWGKTTVTGHSMGTHEGKGLNPLGHLLCSCPQVTRLLLDMIQGDVTLNAQTLPIL